MGLNSTELPAKAIEANGNRRLELPDGYVIDFDAGTGNYLVIHQPTEVGFCITKDSVASGYFAIHFGPSFVGLVNLVNSKRVAA